jgi:poly-gamma-glutamate capsule biosynthesis protein CapA/YwtB (metallophosphatase superfamily)
MAIISNYARLPLISSCLAIAFGLGTPAWTQSPPLTITLTGQSMIRSDIRATMPSAVPTIASLLKGDVIFTNFEGTIAEPGQPNETTPTQGPGANFLAPPEALDALKVVGFNLLSLSNNHAWNLRAVGIQNALREVNRLNLSHAGTGNTLAEAVAPGYLQTPKGTVALVGMASGEIAPGGAATPTRPGVNELRVEAGNVPNEEDAQRILQSIRDASKKADLVIAYQHNHIYDRPFQTIFAEELPDRLVPPDWIKKWTHREVDAGADIVVMHGAPLVQGVEIYHNKPIFYDLGNFIFNLPPTSTRLEEPIVWESVVAYIEFGGRNLQSITFRPIVQNKIGDGQPDVHNPQANNLFLDTRGLPQPATGEQARYILERLADSSRPFGTTLEVAGDVAKINLRPGIKASSH